MYVSIFFTEKTAVSHWWYEFLVQLHKKLKFEILKIKVIGSKTLWEILDLTLTIISTRVTSKHADITGMFLHVYIDK